MATLAELYEETNYKVFTQAVSVAGHLLSNRIWNLTRTFAMGSSPSCSFEIDNPAPDYITRLANVTVFEGFNGNTIEVFNGLVESINTTNLGYIVQCTGQSYRLSAPFKNNVLLTGPAGNSNGNSNNDLLAWLKESFFDWNPPYTIASKYGLAEDSGSDVWGVYHGITPPTNGAMSLAAAQAWLAQHGIPGFNAANFLFALGSSTFNLSLWASFQPNAVYARAIWNVFHSLPFNDSNPIPSGPNFSWITQSQCEAFLRGFCAPGWVTIDGGFTPGTDLMAFLNAGSFVAPNVAYAYGLLEDTSADVYAVYNGGHATHALSDAQATAWLAGHGVPGFVTNPVDVTYPSGLSATAFIRAIMDRTGITNSYVEIGPWQPGTVVAQPLQFSTYADAVNKLAEPFGSPFYEMPNGQVRVDIRDAIPAPQPFRTYYAGIINDDASFAQPANVTNPDALPRLLDVSGQDILREVYNRIVVRGASIPQIGPEGEKNNIQLEETVFALSPWLPPINGEDQYNELTIQNELLDVPADLTACALRYLELENRLVVEVNATVDGDPEVALGMTVEIIDIQNTGINARFMVVGYTTTSNATSYTTSLILHGGRSAGTTPHIAPFANFSWTDQYSQIPPQMDIQSTNSNNKIRAANKKKQYVPDSALPEDDPGTAGQRVIVTFNASAAFDPDGRIVSWDWADDRGRTRSGQKVSIPYDPDAAGLITMTLTVTDNEGLSASVAQSVNINTFGPTDGFSTGEDGGGDNSSVEVVVVGNGVAGISTDGGETWKLYPGSINGFAVGKVANGDAICYLFCGTSSGVVTQDGGDTWTTVQGPGHEPADVAGYLDKDDGAFISISTTGQVQSITVTKLLAGSAWDAIDPLSPSRSDNAFTHGRFFGSYALSSAHLWTQGDIETTAPSDKKVPDHGKGGGGSPTILGGVQTTITRPMPDTSPFAALSDDQLLHMNSDNWSPPYSFTQQTYTIPPNPSIDPDLTPGQKARLEKIKQHGWILATAPSYSAPPYPSAILSIDDDGTVTYVEAPSGTDSSPVDVLSEVDDQVLLVADAGKIYKTVDGGAHLGEVFNVDDDPDSAGGTIRRISTSEVQLMAPEAPLLAVDNTDPVIE